MNSSQTKSIYQFLNSKRKLLRCNANIRFNRTCLKAAIVPKYAQIKIQTPNTAAKRTQEQAQTLRIKNEIKFLRKKTTTQHRTIPHAQSANNWCGNLPKKQFYANCQSPRVLPSSKSTWSIAAQSYIALRLASWQSIIDGQTERHRQ
jgi:hypothetical protein